MKIEIDEIDAKRTKRELFNYTRWKWVIVRKSQYKGVNFCDNVRFP
jgi:hypothetical protein